MKCTVDANVFVAAARPPDVHHAVSDRFLERAHDSGAAFICPTIVLPECAAAIARASGDQDEADRVAYSLQRLPHISFVAADLSLARRAARIAAVHRLRGADAVYCAVAEAAGATLITWDGEMLERCPAVVRTMTPAEWVATQQSATGKPGGQTPKP